MSIMNRIVLCIVFAAAIAACQAAPKIETASGLVSALQQRGVPFTSQEPAPIPQGDKFRFDEGITLKGESLWVDVLRISDRRVFDIAKGAGGILVVAEAVAGQPIPGKPEVYTRYPFVVIIRQQPEGSTLANTLVELLPPEPAQ
ncbi:MAG: hypothetical protein IT364_22630 [Candidatus Hydrogenedentes bacterium]|nr:hypothetical protein [Candidatus Hydrogenedentota bacterium]